MRITKLIVSVALTLIGIAPVSVPAQKSGAKTPPKTVIARSDVRELPADQQIIQALNRLTFGAKPGDILKVRAIGLDKWIDQQLQPEKINDDPMNAFVRNYSALDENQSDLLKQYAEQQQQRREVKRERADTTQAMTADEIAQMRQQQQEANSRREVVTQLQSSRVARAVASERQLQEVMTDFWENHFNIYAAKGAPEPYYLVDFDQNVIRPHALGKFRDLLEAVSQSPAMLFYLDNARSMADSNRPTLRPATAHFISFKLARRFVSDSPSKALVDHAAQVYLKTDGDIREVLRSIITSPEFFSQRAFRSKVKSPFEVVVSAARALNAAPDSTPRSAQLIAYLGQPIFGHQAPNGWPDTGESWMNTGAILNRINFGMAAAAGAIPAAH